MKRLMVLASVVMLGLTSANCSNSNNGASASLLSPSTIDGSADLTSSGVWNTAKGWVVPRGGKKGGGGTGTLTLVVSSDVNGNGSPNWGDTVTFNVSTTATTQPQVGLQCFQSGVRVYNAYTAYYEGYPWPWTQYMLLSSGAWLGGAADCTATLTDMAGTTLGTLKFTAAE